MKKLLFGAGLLIAAPPIAYGYDPYGTDRNWLYYRSIGPGRGNNEESQR